MKEDDDIQVILFVFILKQIFNFTSSLKINLLSEMSLCTVVLCFMFIELFEIIALVQQSFPYSSFMGLTVSC